MQKSSAFLESQEEAFSGDLESLSGKALRNAMMERNEKLRLANDIINLGNDTRIKVFKAQTLRDPSIMLEGDKNFDEMEKKFEALREITQKTKNLQVIDAVEEAADGYKTSMDEFIADWQELQSLGETRDLLGNQMLEAAKTLSNAGMSNTEEISQEATESLNRSSSIMVVGLVLALVIGCILAYFITMGITTSISRVVTGLEENAVQVASASAQISSASQSLAEGASEQAASIEETSSSLEEMSAMTSKNSDNAEAADKLMADTTKTVGSANRSMEELIKSMEEISTASEETSKIIKTIDEIAFQTNLLALNAAVEAARAGEAGAGFAVVADEVRNLAMRAAEASKNTADLIQETVEKIHDGNGLVVATNEAFDEVAKSAIKASELVGEIAAASKEQSLGIGQLNTAVGEMDKVVQQNAANAEESASSSEEMNAMAEQLNRFVKELVALIGGGGGKNIYADYGPRQPRHNPPALKVGHHNGVEHHLKTSSTSSVAGRQKGISSGQAIPLDADFSDF